MLLLACLSALAQAAPEPESASLSSPNLILKLGGQIDSAQGQDLHGKVTWGATEALTLSLSGDRSNLAATTQAPSPNGNATITTITSLGLDYAFGAFDLGLQYDHSDMSDLLTSRRYYLQPAIEIDSWRFGLELSTRTTTFDPIHFRGIPINTASGPVFVTGYADLDVRDTGLGASCKYDGKVWRPYGSYHHYSYGSFQGNTDVTRIRNASGQVSPEMFKLLAGRLVNRLEEASRARLSRRAALLDSTATLGLEADLTQSKWRLEASRDVDHLTSQVSDTYIGTAGWKVTARFTLEVQLGATRSEAFGTDRFAGLSLLFRTRPREHASLLDLLASLD
jgi:hypothetical protein